MNKILVDFLQRIENGEFAIYTPHVLLEVVGKWKHEKLRDKIIEFYTVYSSRKVILDLMSKGVKEEDAVLVFAASAFHLDYLSRFLELLGFFQESYSYAFLHPISKLDSVNPSAFHNKYYYKEIYKPEVLTK